MFYARQDSKAAEPDSFAVRVKTVSASVAQTAAQGVGSAAQTAAIGISNGVRQGVRSVRVWTAPRLESAAEYTTTTAAPKVSSALRISARQIRPADVTAKKPRSALTWSVLAAALLATGGAVAALVRYRYRAGVTPGEGENLEGPGGGTAATGTEAPTPAQAGAASAPGAAADSTADADADADAGVNGRVSTSGW